MKTALIFLAIAILLLVLIEPRIGLWFRKTTIDVHVHDTYFVIARWHAILLIVSFLGTIFSLGGVIGTRFQHKLF